MVKGDEAPELAGCLLLAHSHFLALKRLTYGHWFELSGKDTGHSEIWTSERTSRVRLDLRGGLFIAIRQQLSAAHDWEPDA